MIDLTVIRDLSPQFTDHYMPERLAEKRERRAPLIASGLAKLPADLVEQVLTKIPTPYNNGGQESWSGCFFQHAYFARTGTPFVPAPGEHVEVDLQPLVDTFPELTFPELIAIVAAETDAEWREVQVG